MVRGEAVMRRVWAALFGIPIAVGLAVEIVALGKPKSADPRRDGTATAFLKWASGVEPKHWRRFVLVPLLWLVCLWLPPHVSLGLGPSLRWGRGRRARQ